MNTFEQVQNNLKEKNLHTIKNMQRIMKALERNNLTDDERKVINNIIDNCRKNIDNIEEVTIIEIGAEVDDLIKKIQREFRWNPIEYYQDFEGFIAKNILGLKPNNGGKGKIVKSCTDLDININDLLCFKGLNPFYDVVVDSFIKTINDNYGTNIPLSGIEEQILNEYKSTIHEHVPAWSVIHLREIQRASEALRNGVLYYSLVADDEYSRSK